ncbi:hypothetical protein DPMN_096618 [Dreissena polymorpha]|uniref:Uncharacterized protein n=1 Tax=Dreissena polymorpha TaxID=45954 RepID=A0A9D4LA34_DREPO|nr:hypothetical protein DPMN_096618 [Dreissena polymorpha]
MSTFVTNTKNENRDSSELTIEKRLEEISSKLSNVLTKDDSIFIKDIIKDTSEQLKEKLQGNVIRRKEILENDVFEQKRKIEQLKKESESNIKQIEDIKSQNAALERTNSPVKHLTTKNSQTTPNSIAGGITSE